MSLFPTTLPAENGADVDVRSFYVHCTTQPRRWYFGKVINRQMVLSEEGELMAGLWRELPHHFPLIALDAYACKPDAVCGIITLRQPENGAAPHLLNDVIRWFKNHSGFELRAFNPDFSWNPTHTCLPLKNTKAVEQARWEIQRYC